VSQRAPTSSARSSLAARLAKVLPRRVISDSPDDLAVHGTDKWFASKTPEAVVFAENTEHVSKLLKYCSRHGIPVTPRGAGVGYVGGCVPVRGGVSLSLMRMNKILEINPRDGVAVVEPGVITGDLQLAARKVGWMYPPDPASLRTCSIGGNIATNAGGPRCLKYGVTKHYVLGLQVVLANGDVIEAGGRTHKNKTGFDLCGLITGSEGLLGIVTRATLRLIPLPPARAAISCSFATMPEAAAAVQAVLAAGYLPAALEIADAFTVNAARKYLGSAFVCAGDAHFLLEIDGQKESVKLELRQLEKLLSGLGALSLAKAMGDEECEKLWQVRRVFSESLKATGLKKLNEDVVVPRGRLVDLVSFAARLQRRHGFPVACFGHAGDGNIHVNVMVPDPKSPAAQKPMAAALDELFEKVLAWGGAITGEHGIGLAKKAWWNSATSPELRQAHRAIKKALDPGNILNPGKFV
jgi:glycolate oxidase